MSDDGKAETKEAQKLENDDAAKADQRHRAFQPRIGVSRKSLPIPGGEPLDDDNLSNGSASGGSNNSDDDDLLVCHERLASPSAADDLDEDDPLICRETLPSPPAELLGEDGEFDASTVDSSSPDIDLSRFVSSTEESISTGYNPNFIGSNDVEDSSRIHLDLPQRRSSRSHVPVKRPGSSPEKPARSRKRIRGYRPLPLSSSRKPTSQSARPRKKPTLSRDEDTSDSAPVIQLSKRDEVSDLLNSSTQLAYSWDSLGLGKELGSAALNRYMARLREDPLVTPNIQDLTAQETLQIMSSLRVKTFLPPPQSDLHRVVQKNRFENRLELYGPDESEELSSSTKRTQNGGACSENGNLTDQDTLQCHLPMKTMARLYEMMCSQDADDGLSNRRESHYLSADAITEKLRSLENKACELKLNESEVLCRGRELGLLNPIHRSIPGYANIQSRGENMKSVSDRHLRFRSR